MQTIGIIAEYNPFHQGHFYQISQARSQTGADYVAVALSGDFVQRGEPAIFDKYTRTRMALASGADLVVELPSCFATSSAEDFASCGVALLDHMGIIDTLCFGSEAGELSRLSVAARLLNEEPQTLSCQIAQYVREGISYPAARSRALLSCMGETEQLADDLQSPNNILAIEYLRALFRRGSRIRPFTIKRLGGGYHDTELPDAQTPASASAIRQLLSREASPLPLLRRQIPQGALEALIQEEALCAPVFADDLSLPLQLRLLELERRGIDASVFADVSPELALRLKRVLPNTASFSGRIAQLKTKQYTYTRISRALLHLLLGMTTEAAAEKKGADYVSFLRILGFRASAAPLLSQLKKHCDLPIVTKTAGADRLLSPPAARSLQEDIFVSHFYQSLVFQKGRKMKNEYTKSVIILP